MDHVVKKKTVRRDRKRRAEATDICTTVLSDNNVPHLPDFATIPTNAPADYLVTAVSHIIYQARQKSVTVYLTKAFDFALAFCEFSAYTKMKLYWLAESLVGWFLLEVPIDATAFLIHDNLMQQSMMMAKTKRMRLLMSVVL